MAEHKKIHYDSNLADQYTDGGKELIAAQLGEPAAPAAPQVPPVRPNLPYKRRIIPAPAPPAPTAFGEWEDEVMRIVKATESFDPENLEIYKAAATFAAEFAKYKLARAEQELKNARELCDKFIAERKAEGKGTSCLEAVRAALASNKRGKG